ncbi:MAG TPA: RNA polymerase sigma factor [Candidatus Paceibacterota bacterium]
MKSRTEQVFLAAYEANKNALFRHILMRISGDRDRATDLLSDVFARTWNALCKGKEIENLRAYFYRVAHNLLVDEYGKPKVISLDALSEESEHGELEVSEVSLHSDVVRLGELSELTRALAKLPNDFREVLVLRYIDDMGPSQIAEILGESANTVSVRINRATAALREILNGVTNK